MEDFPRLLKEKQLRSFLATFIDDPSAHSIVREYAEYCIKEKGMRGEVLADHVASFYESGYMVADKEGPHFAVNNVAAANYGGEKDYDIFFYYPAEFIAYNYRHNGRQEKEFEYKDSGLRQKGYDSNNDMLVWTGAKGIPIDAGITFLPGSLKVDRNTGSQYKLRDGRLEVGEGGSPALAEDPISSKDYWEGYFKKNPEQKPNKLIYYGQYLNYNPPDQRTLASEGAAYRSLYAKNEFHANEDFSAKEQDERERLLYEFRTAVGKLTARIESELSREVT